jgi:predicted O-methyltransferase YrrM
MCWEHVRRVARHPVQRAAPGRGSPHHYAEPVPGPVPGRAPTEEPAIRAPTPASWAYAETFVPEDEVYQRARARAAELGCPAVAPGTGAALRLVAAAVQARAVVEIGTGAGVSGLHLLAGMPADGVLTTIDVEAENQRAAREAFVEAGVRSNRTRLIPGRALDVLPRLTDAAYDLVLLDGAQVDHGVYLAQAVRLLRSGGMLAVDNALHQSRVADPAQRDPATTAVRELGKAVRDDDRLVPALLPCGDGLLLAVKR